MLPLLVVESPVIFVACVIIGTMVRDHLQEKSKQHNKPGVEHD